MTTSKTRNQRAGAAQAPANQNGFSLISNQKLLQLYSTMLKCRMIEDRVRIFFNQSRLPKGIHAALGREAVAAGIVTDLLPEDTIAPVPGDAITSFVKDVPLDKLFSQLRACAASAEKGRLASLHRGYAPLNIIDPTLTIGARVKSATGVAVANKAHKNNHIAVVFSSEASAYPGFSVDALNFAAAEDLAMIFVWQNVSPKVPKPPARAENISGKVLAKGFPSIVVDCHDAVAVYRVAHEAMAHARMGHGPTLIECGTYPRQLGSEASADSDRDPILNMENYLANKGLFSDEFKRQVISGFNYELQTAVELARKSPSRDRVAALRE